MAGCSFRLILIMEVLMLLSDAFKLFLADRESYCSAKTLVYYHDNVPRFFDYLFNCLGRDAGSLDCSDVTRSHVTGFVCSLRCSGRKNTTVNTYFRAVKVFLNYCIEEGYCEPDILRKVRFLKNDAAPVVPLSGPEVDEIDGLFNWNTETGMRNLCIVHLMLDAGFRSSEVVNLQYSGINFNGNYLTVKGKGDKYRSVLLCPKLKRMLSHYLIKFRSCVPGDDYPVFARIGSQEPLTAECIKQLFARVKTRTGIVRLHPHLLRHTFATSYIMGGGNLEFLRLMLGHGDYDTTRTYLHLAQEAKMRNSDIYRLDAVFFKSVY